MRKIKVLHIQESISSGGVERTRLSLAKHLNKSVFEQKIICTRSSGNIVEEIISEGVEIITLGKFKNLFHWSHHKKVQQIIKDFQPDIIHGAVFEGVTMAAINGWLQNVPLIIIEETSDPLSRSWRANLLMKIFSHLSDVVIGVSEAVTEGYLKKKLKISPRKVQLVNNGVALPKFINTQQLIDARIEWGMHENDFVVGSVGRMLNDSNKRFSDLLKAFAYFSKDKKNTKLLLIGDGPEKANYIFLAKQLEIYDKVIFAGYQSNVTLFYKMMSIFCLVSANEAFGLVVAEAMLNKIPVVVTKVGGMKYIVLDNITGFTVEPYQVQEIANKFEIFYRNKFLINKMGKKGYARAISEFTEEVYVKKIENIYKNFNQNFKKN